MKTDREKHGLRGSVKNVIVEIARFEEQDGQLTEKPWYSQTMIFNPEGWLIEQTTRNPDGSEMRAVSDYSDSQKLQRTRIYESSGALVDEVRYIYDDEKRLVAEQRVSRDGNLTTPVTYAYDTAGRKTKIEELDYSEEATLMVGIEGTMSAFNASEVTRIETRYDDRDNPIEVKTFNSTGSVVSRVEIVRDVRGNAIEETQYHGDVVRFGPGSASPEQIEALSDEEKAEFAAVVAQMFGPGTVMSKQTHEYDADGRLIESTRDYDEHGNWTKELVSNGDAESGTFNPTHVTRRTITYYT